MDLFKFVFFGIITLEKFKMKVKTFEKQKFYI